MSKTNILAVLAIAFLGFGMYFLINNDSAKLSAKAGIAQEWAAGICLVAFVGTLFFISKQRSK